MSSENNISRIKARLAEIDIKNYYGLEYSEALKKALDDHKQTAAALNLLLDSVTQARDDFDQADMTFQRDIIDDDISTIAKILTGEK